MSTQVYASGGHPAGNKIIGELVKPTPDGGISVNSLTIASAPTTNNTSAPFLVRNPASGLIEQRDSSTVPHAGETKRGKTLDQIMGDAAETAITFPDTLLADPGLLYDNGTGTFTVAPDYPGQFTVAWTVSWAANAVGVRWTWINVNGLPARYGSVNTIPTSFDQALSASVDLILTGGDSFVIVAYQASGGPLAVLGSATNGIDFSSMNVSRTSIAGFQ